MGLAIEVGFLSDMLKNDPEGAKYFQENLRRLNDFLTSKKLLAHQEPQNCQVISFDMYGYSGLHYLRRVAAHLDLHSSLPEPGNKVAAKDPVIEEYHRHAKDSKSGFLGRLFQKPRALTFNHLMLHSDAEGYYIPQDFESVLCPEPSLKIPGGMVGSSIRLREECKRLALALGLPLDLDPDSEIVWDATESKGEGETQWQRYGIESFICLRLFLACEHSIKSGAAIVFC